jgi:hypothetical protein
MGFDQPAAAQASLRVVGRRVGSQGRLDGGNPALRKADIGLAAVGRARKPRIADDEVEHRTNSPWM